MDYDDDDDDDNGVDTFCCACGSVIPGEGNLFPPESAFERKGFLKGKRGMAVQQFWTNRHRVSKWIELIT